MRVKTLAFQELLQDTEDAFEAVVVLSQRSEQINTRRMAERANLEEDVYEEEEISMSEPVENPDYVEEEKCNVLSMEDFLDKNLKWRYTSKDDASEGEEK
jgi:hypothetical protein